MSYCHGISHILVAVCRFTAADYESNLKSKVPTSGFIGFVEKDGVNGFSRPDEAVHVGDIILPTVVVLVKCNNWWVEYSTFTVHRTSYGSATLH